MRLEADRQSEVSIGNVQRYVSGHRNRAGFDLLQMGRIFDRAAKAGRIAGGKELLCLRRPAYLDSFSLGAAPRAKSDDPAERLLCARNAAIRRACRTSRNRKWRPPPARRGGWEWGHSEHHGVQNSRLMASDEALLIYQGAKDCDRTRFLLRGAKKQRSARGRARDNYGSRIAVGCTVGSGSIDPARSLCSDSGPIAILLRNGRGRNFSADIGCLRQ